MLIERDAVAPGNLLGVRNQLGLEDRAGRIRNSISPDSLLEDAQLLKMARVIQSSADCGHYCLSHQFREFPLLPEPLVPFAV